MKTNQSLRTSAIYEQRAYSHGKGNINSTKDKNFCLYVCHILLSFPTSGMTSCRLKTPPPVRTAGRELVSKKVLLCVCYD